MSGMLFVILAAAASPVCTSPATPTSCHTTAPTADETGGGFVNPARLTLPPPIFRSGIWESPVPAPTTSIATEPTLATTMAAAIYSRGASEPLVIAWMRYRYDPAPGATHLTTFARYEFRGACDVDDDPLCRRDSQLNFTYPIAQTQAYLRKRYRLTALPGAPQAAVSVPILVDYHIHEIQTEGRPTPEGPSKGVRHDLDISFGYVQVGGPTSGVFYGTGIHCASSGVRWDTSCRVRGASDPLPMAGTFTYAVGIDPSQTTTRDDLVLQLNARLNRPLDAHCEPRPNLPGTPCHADPWEAEAHVILDPWAHIDPDFEHAEFFLLEMDGDDASGDWVVPQASPEIDPLTFTFLIGHDTGDDPEDDTAVHIPLPSDPDSAPDPISDTPPTDLERPPDPEGCACDNASRTTLGSLWLWLLFLQHRRRRPGMPAPRGTLPHSAS